MAQWMNGWIVGEWNGWSDEGIHGWRDGLMDNGLVEWMGSQINGFKV